jgi:hypothetical protein
LNDYFHRRYNHIKNEQKREKMQSSKNVNPSFWALLKDTHFIGMSVSYGHNCSLFLQS